jgi:hypothetical protein
MPRLNTDQVALVKWILCGLKIPEVVTLNGDASYLLGNMIAKFSIAAGTFALSVDAMRVLKSQGVDFLHKYDRYTFYGKKKPFIYEHPVPCSIVRKHIINVHHTYESLVAVLRKAGPTTVNGVMTRSRDIELPTSRCQTRF